MGHPEVRQFTFPDDGKIPNHPFLPVLLYPAVFRDRPEQTERVFNRNNWRNSWTNGIFDFHHYHSNTHEALGVIGGSVIVILGGEQGSEVELRTGDVVVLPAGTGHKLLRRTPDFAVVGAYPNGKTYNMKTDQAEGASVIRAEIEKVPVPDTDPVCGDRGPLVEIWQAALSG